MIFFSVYRFEIIFYGRQISIPNAKGKKKAPELCDYELTWLNATFLDFDFSSSFVRRVC